MSKIIPYGRQHIIEADIKAEQFRLDNDSIGVVNVQGKYNSKDGKIIFNASSLNDAYSFLANGKYSLALGKRILCLRLMKG